MRKSLLILFISVNYLVAAQTNISGIINIYTPVISIDYCSQTITVSNPSGFSVGDKVLLIQMKGASVDLNNNPAFGSILNYNDAGNYEFAIIASIYGNKITFVNTILRNYNTNDKVQLVSVPVYTNAIVNGILTCPQWNGSTGGVLVLECTGNLTLNANIDASGKGFSGGIYQNVTTSGPYFPDYFTNNAVDGALKGEGIANVNAPYLRARGAIANGGGGGSNHNGGGAGGANGGQGGHGGDYLWQDGGLGGYDLAYSLAINKIFTGGGGGAGHGNDGHGTGGENGGGIIIIKASNIYGSGIIKSNGIAASPSYADGDDGAGGGGAGGTVLINASSIANTVFIEASGGKGGDNTCTFFKVGPGGGGGGGIVWFSNASLPLPLNNLDVDSGLNGVLISYSNNPVGATAGGMGKILTGLQLPIGVKPLKVKLGNDTTFCIYDSLSLSPGMGFTSYLWQDGSNLPFYKVKNTGVFWVEVINNRGCKLRDTINIIQSKGSMYTFSKTICYGDSILINGTYLKTSGNYYDTIDRPGSCDSISVFTLLFDNGYNFNNYINICKGQQYYAGGVYQTKTGIYQDLYKTYYGCDSLIITHLTVFPTLSKNIDTSICNGDNYYAGGKFQTTPGIYFDTLKSEYGCDSIVSTNLRIKPNYWQNIDTSICEGQNYYAGGNYQNITGIYYDTFNTNYHCDSIIITNLKINKLPFPSLGNDTIICNRDMIFLNPGKFHSYLWQDNSNDTVFTVTEPGKYWVFVQNEFNCGNSDSINVEEGCKPDIEIPNIFTPNNDGINDVFIIKGKQKEHFEMIIYNRWGQKVFSTLDFYKGWDGTSNGVKCSDGVYYWIIGFDGKKNSGKEYMAGTVTLIK